MALKLQETIMWFVYDQDGAQVLNTFSARRARATAQLIRERKGEAVYIEWDSNDTDDIRNYNRQSVSYKTSMKHLKKESHE
jgi:hypothetical protein